MTDATPVPGTLAHFAINVDDLEAAQEFYGAVFGWGFDAWGPEGFFKIRTADGGLPGPIGALQQRRELAPGLSLNGLEATVAVEDVHAVVAQVRAGGGTVLLEPTTIPGVGELAFFADPSGNVCGAMRYEA